jgi:hypothetical protein
VWLGIATAVTGVLFALARFVTVYWLRQLREAVLMAQHETAHNEQRLALLAERQGLQVARQRALVRRTEEMRAVTERQYLRLAAMLPRSLVADLERCRTLHAEPAGRDLRLLQDLGLLARVNQALDPMSLLLLRTPAEDEAAQTWLAGQLAGLANRQALSYRQSEDGVVVCSLPHPDSALSVLRGLSEGETGAGAAMVSAAVYAGMIIPDEASEVHRLLARNLLHARRLLEQAVPGTALVNRAAYRALSRRDGLEPYEPDPRLYRYALVAMPTTAAGDG